MHDSVRLRSGGLIPGRRYPTRTAAKFPDSLLTAAAEQAALTPLRPRAAAEKQHDEESDARKQADPAPGSPATPLTSRFA